MGKGDKKSKRGKIVIGSYGVNRPRKSRNVSAAPVAAEAPKTAAKAPAKKAAKKKEA
jgi:30S ribosomal protein S31